MTEVPYYTAPITSQEGAIILNAELMKSEDLSMPTSLKDLTKKEYKKKGVLYHEYIQRIHTNC